MAAGRREPFLDVCPIDGVLDLDIMRHFIEVFCEEASLRRVRQWLKSTHRSASSGKAIWLSGPSGPVRAVAGKGVFVAG
ncbi:hypothetical protein BCY90_15565 [Agrobacterium deltaense]|nr:hypothetical protein BCY90_15565 [Agrobacterium deltaense]